MSYPTLGTRGLSRALISLIFHACYVSYIFAARRSSAVPDFSRKHATREPLVPRVELPLSIMEFQYKIPSNTETVRKKTEDTTPIVLSSDTTWVKF